MAARRLTTAITILFLLVLGLSLYLAMGGNSNTGAFLYPEEAPELLPPEGNEVPPLVDPEIDREVVFSLQPRARLIPPAESLPQPLSLSYGEDEFLAELSVLAGPRSLPEATASGRNLLRLQLPTEDSIYRIIELPAAGEPATHLALGGQAVLRGRVLDQIGQGIPGARVWVGTSDSQARLQWTKCGEDGSFEEVIAYAGEGIPIVAQAPGHASIYRVVKLQAADSGRIDLHLEKAVRVDVQLAAIMDAPATGRLYLRPAAGETRLREYPFFLHALEPGLNFDSKASCRIEDLPGAGAVELLLQHAQAILPAPEQLHLKRRPQRIVLQAAKVALIRGRVRDDAGAPITAASLRCQRGSLRPDRELSAYLLPPGAMAQSGSLAFSDSEGGFTIAYPRPSSADLRIQIRAPGHWGLEMQVTASAADLQRDFELPRRSDSDGKPSLRFLHAGESAQVIRAEGGAWQLWPAGEAFEQELREAAVIDLLVRSHSRAGGATTEERFTGLRVTGPVDLAIKLGK